MNVAPAEIGVGFEDEGDDAGDERGGGGGAAEEVGVSSFRGEGGGGDAGLAFVVIRGC